MAIDFPILVDFIHLMILQVHQLTFFEPSKLKLNLFDTYFACIKFFEQ